MERVIWVDYQEGGKLQFQIYVQNEITISLFRREKCVYYRFGEN